MDECWLALGLLYVATGAVKATDICARAGVVRSRALWVQVLVLWPLAWLLTASEDALNAQGDDDGRAD